MKQTTFLDDKKVKLAMDYPEFSFSVQLPKEKFANEVFKLLITKVGEVKALEIMAMQKEPTLNLEGVMPAQDVAIMLEQSN